MKTWLRTLSFLAAMLTVFFISGPKIAVYDHIHPLELPEDLDAYIAAKENKFPDIRPGTHSQIQWLDPQNKSKTPVSVVYLHGFSATRQETAPLSANVAQKLGANLFETRLRGHGRSADAMGEATAGDWLNDAVEALEIGKRLGNEVIIIGVSTGATLGVWLAATQDVSDVRAFVNISPNFAPKDSNAQLLLLPWGNLIAKAILGDYREWTPRVPEQAKYWSTRYPTSSLLEMMALVDLVENTDLQLIDSPSLFIYCPDDKVINAQLVETRFEEIRSKNKKLVAVDSSTDASCHVIAGDILSPENTPVIAEEIIEFVMGLGDLKPPKGMTIPAAALPQSAAQETDSQR